MPGLPDGSRLGRYEIVAFIAAGGMGEVYRAHDTRLRRDVALKLLPDRLAQDPSALDRFEREARAVAALSHTNILAIHDLEFDSGRVFSVSELLDGRTLRDILTERRLSDDEALDLASQIGRGLAAAHARGIIHRDVKPENVVITASGIAKILDFGLALPAISGGADSNASTQSAPSTPGGFVGTVAYAAPEAVRGEVIGPGADIFSFGCLLHEMVTGAKAFGRATAGETFAAILNEAPSEPLPGRPESGPVLAIARRCMAKNAADRYARIADAVRELEGLRQSSRPANRPTTESRAHRRNRISSVAVLPLVGPAGGSPAEAISDGILDGLLDALASFTRLRVMARASVERFRDDPAGPVRAGRELSVDAVVTGSLALGGDRLRASLEMVDGRDGARLWAERFERPSDCIGALQEDIVRSLAGRLGLRISAVRAREIARRFSRNAEAYEAYLHGRRILYFRTERTTEEAVRLFEKVIHLDPGFALAHVALAECHVLLAGYGHHDPRETYPRARAAARRAIEIDRRLGEAHTTLGSVIHRYDWNWPEAERQFRRAIELSPGSVTAHHWYGLYLLTMSRFREAREQVAMALELDPLSAAARDDAAYILYSERLFSLAADQYRGLLALDPDFAHAHLGLAIALVETGDLAGAVFEAARGEELSGGTPRAAAQTAYVLARAGRCDEAREIEQRLAADSSGGYIPRFSLALISVALGQTETALDRLDEAFTNHEDALVSIRINPRLDPLREHPRFRELAARVGL